MPFDFAGTDTRIGAQLDTQRSDIEIPTIKADDKQSISVEGTVEGTIWDKNKGKCTVNINGTAVDDKTQENQDGVTLPYSTGALTESECLSLSEGAKVVVRGTDIDGSSLSGGAIYSDQLGARGSIGDNGLSTNNTVTIHGHDVDGLYYTVDKSTGSLILTDKDGNAWTENNTAALNKYTENNASGYEMCNNYQGDTDICAVYADGRREKVNSNANAKQSLNNTYASEKESIEKRTRGVDGSSLGLSSISIQEVSNNNASIGKTLRTTIQAGVNIVVNGDLNFNGIRLGLDDIYNDGNPDANHVYSPIPITTSEDSKKVFSGW